MALKIGKCVHRCIGDTSIRLMDHFRGEILESHDTEIHVLAGNENKYRI